MPIDYQKYTDNIQKYANYMSTADNVHDINANIYFVYHYLGRGFNIDKAKIKLAKLKNLVEKARSNDNQRNCLYAIIELEEVLKNG